MSHPTLLATFGVRAVSASHPLSARLLRLMETKQSNLCLSADVTSATELLELARTLGPSLAVFKTHHDLVSDWDYDPVSGTGAQLAALAREHRFLIFEDRKFCDIGNTVQMQYTSGAARLIEWAHIVNVNMMPGKASVAALAEAAATWQASKSGGNNTDGGEETARGLLILAQMSSAGNLMTPEYTQACVDAAREHCDFVMGFISQRSLNTQSDDAFVHMMPGCQLPPPGHEETAGDGKGQQYSTPAKLIGTGVDVVIVGRGILNAEDRVAEAERYRKAAWDAYLARVSS